MMRTTADMVIDYLKHYYDIGEIPIKYENPDGRIIFFINKRGVEDTVKKKLMEQIKDIGGEHYEKLTKILHEIITNPRIDDLEKDDDRKMLEERLSELRRRIYEVENKQFTEIIDRKFKESQEMKRTKGFYKTVVDILGEKDENDKYKFDTWQMISTPDLYTLEQVIYVEDGCKSEPKCGNCGDYIFFRKIKLEKKAKEKKEDIEKLKEKELKEEKEAEEVDTNEDEEDKEISAGRLVMTNFGQDHLLKGDIDYLLNNEFDVNEPKVIGLMSRTYDLLAKRLGKEFREVFNAKRITKEEKNKKGKIVKVDILENWEICKNYKEVEEELETIRKK